MDDHNCIVLAIHNFAHGTVQIAPGQTLGELHAVNEVSVPALEEEITVNTVSPLLGDREVHVDDSLSENDKRVIGSTFEEHLENLNKVFERLQEAGLHLKPKKCHLIQPAVEYLGYVVSAEGISADPKKVVSILEFPVPTNVKSFLGLTSYYRRFVQDFSRIAQPLHALTRKDVPFIWDVKCQEAFDSLKTLLTDSTVLAFPDFQLDFILETDASKLRLGAILSQNQPD